MALRFEPGRFLDTLSWLTIPPPLPAYPGRGHHWHHHRPRVTGVLQHRPRSVDTTHTTLRVGVQGTVSLACHLHVTIVWLLDHQVIVQAAFLKTLGELIAKTWFPRPILPTHQLVVG